MFSVQHRSTPVRLRQLLLDGRNQKFFLIKVHIFRFRFIVLTLSNRLNVSVAQTASVRPSGDFQFFLNISMKSSMLSNRSPRYRTCTRVPHRYALDLTWLSDSFKISCENFNQIQINANNGPAEGKSHSNQHVWASSCLPSHSSRSADDRWPFSRRFFVSTEIHSGCNGGGGAIHLPEGDGTNGTHYANDCWLLTDSNIWINETTYRIVLKLTE